MIAKLSIVALIALVAGPLFSFHQLRIAAAAAPLCLVESAGRAVYALDAGRLVRIEPLLAGAM
jgi:hypothetical protein